MRIQPKSNIPDFASAQLTAAKAREAILGHDKLALAGSKDLEEALQNNPDVRPDAVARARTLIDDPSYPSGNVVRAVADKLSLEMPPPHSET